MTLEQTERLEKGVRNPGQVAPRQEMRGMFGILEEGREHLEEDADPSVLDAVMIADARRAEHYEISPRTAR